MKILYQCENCKSTSPSRYWIFRCYECDEEICEDCMFGWGRCVKCAAGQTREELEKKFKEESCEQDM